MASDDDERRNPDVRRGIEGAAHFYDLFRRFTRGEDPETRHLMRNLDQYTLQDVLDGLSLKANQEVPDPHPKPEIVDTHIGIDVHLDIQDTQVEPENLAAAIQDEGKRLKIFDTKTGWYLDVTPQDEADTMTDSRLDRRAGGVAVVHVAYNDASIDGRESSRAEVDDQDTDEAPQAAEPSSPFDGVPPQADPFDPERFEDLDEEEIPTLEEFLRDNPWAEMMFAQMAGPEDFAAVRKTFGDRKVTDLPGMGVPDGAASETSSQAEEEFGWIDEPEDEEQFEISDELTEEDDVDEEEDSGDDE